jgi:hypothetical protein
MVKLPPTLPLDARRSGVGWLCYRAWSAVFVNHGEFFLFVLFYIFLSSLLSFAMSLALILRSLTICGGNFFYGIAPGGGGEDLVTPLEQLFGWMFPAQWVCYASSYVSKVPDGGYRGFVNYRRFISDAIHGFSSWFRECFFALRSIMFQ